jgi:hypothetical protein
MALYVSSRCLAGIQLEHADDLKDVEWWLRSTIQQANYTTWFQPDVSIVRADTRWPNSTSKAVELGPVSILEQDIIQYGDLLHCDFGVTALGMNTDTQHLAYVLPPGETEVPAGLLAGLAKGNRMQDIVKSSMKIGRSGNEILQTCLEQMAAEDIDGRIYSHPIGAWTCSSPLTRCMY